VAASLLRRIPILDPAESSGTRLTGAVAALVAVALEAAVRRLADASHRRRTSIPDLAESSCTRLTEAEDRVGAVRQEIHTLPQARRPM
jgi:hypothetical protein